MSHSPKDAKMDPFMTWLTDNCVFAYILTTNVLKGMACDDQSTSRHLRRLALA